MRKFKWTSYPLLILFAAFIWGYSLIDAFAPARAYSEMENRYLQQMPKFSFRSLFNNTFTLKVEEFTNDQFFLRDGWITLKSLCETALGKIENNGIVYGKDHYMFEKRLSVDEEQLEKNVSSLLEFRKKFPDENITLMLVPSSDAVLTDKLPRGLNNIDQLAAIGGIYRRAGEAGIKTPDIASIFSRHAENGEYIYYRTDHHWTADGAFLAYNSYVKSLGLKEQIPDKFNGVRDFYGTYYSKAKLFSTMPDIIHWRDVPVKSVTINGEAADGLYDLEKFNTRDKYAAFLHGNNGVTVIESGCNTNHIDGETSRILLIKDSFGNSFAPFLCYGFDEVTVIDLRYFSETEKLVDAGSYDEILILYGFSTFSQETSVANLKM